MASIYSFGESKKDFLTTGKMEEVDALLATYAQVFIKSAQRNLRSQKKIVTGELMNMTFDVKFMGKGYELTLGYPKDSKAAEYWDYVNKGVAGVGKTINGSPYKFKTKYANKKMAGAILMWIRRNSIRPTEKKKLSGLERKRKSIRKLATEANSVKQLAYAISTKIKREGLKQTNYFDNALKLFNSAEFQKDLSEAVGFEVQVAIKNSWENNK